MLNPLYLSDAFGQSRIQEDYLASTKRSLRQRGERGIATVGGSSSSWGQFGDGSSKPRKLNYPTQKISSFAIDEKLVWGFVNITKKCGT